MIKLGVLTIIVFLVGIIYREYKRYKIYMEADDKREQSEIRLKTKVVEAETALSDKVAEEMDSKINDLKGENVNDD